MFIIDNVNQSKNFKLTFKFTVHTNVHKDIEARFLAHWSLYISAKCLKTLLRCPWRWGNTCSHSEHRSQAQQRRLYCHKWETSTVPNYKKTIRIGWSLSFLECFYTIKRKQIKNKQYEWSHRKHRTYSVSLKGHRWFFGGTRKKAWADWSCRGIQ